MKKEFKQIVRTGLVVMLGTAWMANANADGPANTSQFQVTAIVNNVCNTVTSTKLDFGAYNPLSGTPDDQTNTVTVQCTNGTPYKIRMNKGSNAAGDARQMIDGANHTLAYSIFSDINRTKTWGDGDNTAVSGAGTGAAQTVTAYGRIAAGLNVPVGTYNDTITVTLTY